MLVQEASAAFDARRAPTFDWPPRWASAWGDDQFGLWSDVEVHDARQRMRWIEPGGFFMGSSGFSDQSGLDCSPRHHVILTQGFWLADTPCTRRLWVTVAGAGDYRASGRQLDFPVEDVSWHDAAGFLRKLAGFLPTGVVPTLPTEAQWEYACRAGSQSEFWWGDEFEKKYANADSGQYKTTTVARFRPNRWGLFDMHGNVWEWCQDGVREYSDTDEIDPVGPQSSNVRIIRGGSCSDPSESARSCHRGMLLRESSDHFQGFRFSISSRRADTPAATGLRGRP